jgi:hypothetical protein
MHSLAECIEVGLAAQSERFLIVDQPAGLEVASTVLILRRNFFRLQKVNGKRELRGWI